MTTNSVRLQSPASEMAREEIAKQVAFLSKTISNVRFSEDGTSISFEADAAESEGLQASVQQLGNRIARALRSLQRKIVFSSAAAADPKFSTAVRMEGIHFMGNGQVALSGLPLRLFDYFDRVFEDFGRP